MTHNNFTTKGQTGNENNNTQTKTTEKKENHKFSDKPRLTYFNARGRAEIIRLIFNYLEVPFEDVRFRHPPYAMDDFKNFKNKINLPFGQVPVLEIDGLILVQSQSIVRYISRKYGLIADNDIENAIGDMIHCGAEDLKQKFTSAILNSGNDSNLKLFELEVCNTWGGFFESLLEKNGGTWFVGDKLTYSDLAVYDTLTAISWKIPDAFSDFKLLQEHIKRIEAIPSVATWLKDRPDAVV